MQFILWISLVLFICKPGIAFEGQQKGIFLVFHANNKSMWIKVTVNVGSAIPISN